MQCSSLRFMRQGDLVWLWPAYRRSISGFFRRSALQVRQLMKKVIAFAIAPMLVLLAACGGSSTAKINNLSADEFASNIQNPATVIIDVRTPGEFASGHIERAINIDVEAANFDTKIAKLDKNVEYSIYCHSGRRSAIAAQKMADAGFTKITNLKDGIISWQSAGYPLVVG